MRKIKYTKKQAEAFTAADLRALKSSANRYRKIGNMKLPTLLKQSFGVMDCGLCKIHLEGLGNCRKCPVGVETNLAYCCNTPYQNNQLGRKLRSMGSYGASIYTLHSHLKDYAQPTDKLKIEALLREQCALEADYLQALHDEIMRLRANP